MSAQSNDDSRKPLPKGNGVRAFWRRGEPQVWITAATLASTLALAFILLFVVIVNGVGVFWPSDTATISLTGGEKIIGRILRTDVNPDTQSQNVQIKTANRELDAQRQDFRWVKQDAIQQVDYPESTFVLERAENGDFYGLVDRFEGPDIAKLANAPADAASLQTAIDLVQEKQTNEITPLAAQLSALSKQLDKARTRLVQLKHRQEAAKGDAAIDAAIAELEANCDAIKRQSDEVVDQQQKRMADLRQNKIVMKTADGKPAWVAVVDIVRFYQPNAMGFFAKCWHYAKKLGELLWDDPRESNTEGGLFPAIFGTVMLIFLMAVLCFPLGVLAGIYLGEYAKDGFWVRIVRIAVNNLAGIPSIVYGIFGLGFFVYGVGGWIDQWFFAEQTAAGTPTFGTGGILWASLTLGLLTVPVVIVSTEEALRAIPRATREGSLALGATKFQTLVRVLVPMASPGMMTGFILAMARAAGEVAPLMITGVVKLAPQMPVDGQFPFFHLDRKFMHLGFHIYDVGFQSPNVEASKPMVYVTTLLLLLIVLAMTSTAIYLRNRMRSRYASRTI
jgi:phosphate transport system permease protein